MAPQLAPPKIPEGERVDFDVSGRIKVSFCRLHLVTETQITPFVATLSTACKACFNGKIQIGMDHLGQPINQFLLVLR